jgi:hypothetical protein
MRNITRCTILRMKAKREISVKKTQKASRFLLCFFVVAILTFGLSACARPYADILKENSRNQKLWENKKPDNYTYSLVVNWQYFPPPEVPREPPVPSMTIKVKDGFVYVTNMETGEIIERPDPSYTNGMRSLFNLVQQAVKDKAESITAQYDSDLGYASHIFIEHGAPDQGIGTIREYVVKDFVIN